MKQESRQPTVARRPMVWRPLDMESFPLYIPTSRKVTAVSCWTTRSATQPIDDSGHGRNSKL